MGFLGNSAPYQADLNLIAQIVVLALLLAGASLARVSEFKLHGRLMLSAIAFQFVAVFSWMLPSLIINIGALGSGGVGTAITLSHVYFGACVVSCDCRRSSLETGNGAQMDDEADFFGMVPRGNSRSSILRTLLSGHHLNPDDLAFLEFTIALQLVDLRTNDFQISSY